MSHLSPEVRKSFVLIFIILSVFVIKCSISHIFFSSPIAVSYTHLTLPTKRIV